MPSNEQNVQVTPGSGAGVDTVNVGTGAVGSTSEALRQVVVIGDPSNQAAMVSVDSDGNIGVSAEMWHAMFRELRRIRLGISILVNDELLIEEEV